ncbi:MAG TPA: ankyrin repeat domain-containing protein [Streptomyces sp.]|nr:ankyrin repeat domain-containing protein [Streptomyces sp.]
MTAKATATPQDLFAEVYGGEDDAVVRLLRSGVPAEAANEEGETALYLSAVNDRPGMVRLLLAAGADPDRASGPEAGDLPLCGAAVGGHTEVVEALLAAGARPDLREQFGFTAMAWAVGQGHAGTVEALLEHGADPDLPGPGGEPPLVLATRRGSAETVRTLLRHGASAQREALAEARRWLETDVEHELREWLRETYGATPAETVIRRINEDGAVTVVVELVRDGLLVAGREQQTGHAAIATVLEEKLGVRTPFAELAERALRGADPDRDEWLEAVAALWRRGDEETFQAATAWCASGDPLRRAFAADVLGQLGSDDDSRPFASRALPLLRELAREAEDAELVRAAVLGLGQQGDPAALPEILRHASHPDAQVRHRVALSLVGLVPGDDRAGAAALVTLSGDPDDDVRDWATLALAGIEADTPDIREALAARLDDRDPDTAAEAARGLAVRQDPRAVDALARILGSEDPQGYAYAAALETLEYVEDETVRRRLERTPPRNR